MIQAFIDRQEQHETIMYMMLTKPFDGWQVQESRQLPAWAHKFVQRHLSHGFNTAFVVLRRPKLADPRQLARVIGWMNRRYPWVGFTRAHRMSKRQTTITCETPTGAVIRLCRITFPLVKKASHGPAARCPTARS